MSETVTRTLISQNQVYTPLLVANEAEIGKVSLNNVESLHAKDGFIENLTIKELTVLDDPSAQSDSAEVYENAVFNEIILNFTDAYNCKYTIADHTSLESNEDGLMVNISAEVPEELGAKLVCRYLVLDLRELASDTNVGVTWPTQPIKWLYGLPDIEAGYFYVIALQRFTKDLIVGNVTIKIEGNKI